MAAVTGGCHHIPFGAFVVVRPRDDQPLCIGLPQHHAEQTLHQAVVRCFHPSLLALDQERQVEGRQGRVLQALGFDVQEKCGVQVHGARLVTLCISHRATLPPTW